MKKTLIIATILLTTALLIGGIYYPNAYLMWFAGTSTAFAVVRAGLIVILGILLFSNPPRAHYFRYGLAFVAVVLGIVTVACVMSYKLSGLDASVFIETAIIFGIEALEISTEDELAVESEQKHSFAR